MPAFVWAASGSVYIPGTLGKEHECPSAKCSGSFLVFYRRAAWEGTHPHDQRVLYMHFAWTLTWDLGEWWSHMEAQTHSKVWIQDCVVCTVKGESPGFLELWRPKMPLDSTDLPWGYDLCILCALLYCMHLKCLVLCIFPNHRAQGAASGGFVTHVFRLLVAWQHHRRSPAGQPHTNVSGGSGR